MSASDMACLILASGLSQRFGAEDKLDAALVGETVLSHVLKTVTALNFGQVYVVTRDRQLSGVTAIFNADPEAGQGHALRLGVTALLSDHWPQAMVVLGDMPLVRSSHLEALIEKADRHQSVISLSEGRRLPPAIFPNSALELIAAQNSMAGANVIFEQLNPLTVPIDADSARDVDTPEDLARVTAIMKARST